MSKIIMPKNELFNRGDDKISKPNRFSAFGHLNNPKFLDYLLEKSDEEIEGVDYRDLLNSNILAGTFEETVYYLPLAVDYLCSNADDLLEMIDEFVDYIFVNRNKIENIFNITVEVILDYVFNCNTEEHSVVYVNKAECKALGWGINSYTYVKKSGLMTDLFKNVNRFECGRKWIESKIKEMKDGDDTQKKWLYTLYEECNEVFGLYLDDEVILEILDDIEK